MDPLTLLREHTVAGQPVTLEGDHILFGVTRFARTAPTAYRASVASIAGGFYPVDALWFLLQNADAKQGEYVKTCKAQGIAAVSLVDKKGVLQYLRGEVESTRAIDWAGAPVVQARRVPALCFVAARRARPPAPTPTARPSFRVRSRSRPRRRSRSRW